MKKNFNLTLGLLWGICAVVSLYGLYTGPMKTLYIINFCIQIILCAVYIVKYIKEQKNPKD